MGGVPQKVMTIYCIIDEMSTGTLVDQRLVTFFGRSFLIVNYEVGFATKGQFFATQGHKVTGL